MSKYVDKHMLIDWLEEKQLEANAESKFGRAGAYGTVNNFVESGQFDAPDLLAERDAEIQRLHAEKEDLMNVNRVRHADIEALQERIKWLEEGSVSHQTEQPDTKHVELRPPVRWFAEQMQKKLIQNDHKGGWSQCTTDYLYRRLKEEYVELIESFVRGQPSEKITKEAADVANFAMMIADNARPQPAPKGEDSNG